MQDNLNSDYRVSSFIKPSVPMSDIATSLREEIHPLTINDVIVIWGGVKDIGRKNTVEAIALHIITFSFFHWLWYQLCFLLFLSLVDPDPP
jgi:hypothetical protein